MEEQWVIEWAGMDFGPYDSIASAAKGAEFRGLIRFGIKQLMPRFEDEPAFVQAETIE